VAFVVARPGQDVDPVALRDHVARRLPDYMVPAAVVPLVAFPLTPNGKIDRNRLVTSTMPRPGLTADYVAPRDEMEARLAGIWCDVLGVESVGIHDDFLALGGDSILSLRVAGLAAQVGIPLLPAQLLEYPTIAELAGRVRTTARDAAGSRRPAEDSPPELSQAVHPIPADVSSRYADSYPVGKVQAMMLDESQRRPPSEGVYHLQYVLGLRDPSFSLDALRGAVQAVVRRNPILATRFLGEDGARIQAIPKEVAIPVAVEDIRDCDAEAQDRRVDLWMADDRGRPFTVGGTHEPLFRVRAFLRTASTFDLGLSFHHAIIDGWSVTELLSQFAEAYRAVKVGRDVPDDAAPFNAVKEYATLEQEIVRDAAAAAFWASRLVDIKPPPLVPRGRAEGLARAIEGTLRPEIVAGIRRLGRELKVSTKTILLDALLTLVGSITGRDSATVGLVTNVRSERLSDPLGAIGLFWNIVPIGCWLGGDLATRLRRLRIALAEVAPFASFPLPEIMARAGKAPLFLATLNYVRPHNLIGPRGDVGLELLSLRGEDTYHFPLNFALVDSPLDHGLSYRVTYDRAYFDATGAAQVAARYEEVLGRGATVMV
jgi:hypothetical protein